MEDIKALTENAECSWDYIYRLRMALSAACKERDELKKQLHEAKSELDKYRKAEQDGRLVVLPWAAGDVIYEADPAHGVVKHTFAENPAWMMHSYAVYDAGNEWYDGWGSSDETPFYKTREEAEAALKGGEG